MKSLAFSSDLLLSIFTGAALPTNGLGNLYVSLHTGDPGSGSNQTSNEANYTGYARVALAQNTSGWTVLANQVLNAAVIAFPVATGGTNTITHFGIGTAASGAGFLLYSGPLITSYFNFVGVGATGTITAPNHTLSLNDTVEVIALAGGALPSGIASGTVYYVASVNGDEITISTSQGGGAVALGSDGSGAIGKIGTLVVTNNITPQFVAGALMAAQEF